ncbi:MAG: halocarboxylic acid dehydrogenase DehI family protein [Chloroflexota bacterium]
MAVDTSLMAEVSEADAQGAVKAIYDDIKNTLRVPVVNLVFRVLATQPDFLQLAWRQLEPNLRTVYFESRADVIRAAAVQGAEKLGSPPKPEDSGVASLLGLFHYVNPKLLLAVAVLRSAVNGQYPMLEKLPESEKRQIETGVDPRMPTISLIDEETASPAIADIFADIKATLGIPVLNTDYRALATYPSYLQIAWEALKPATSTAGYRSLERELRMMAEQTILVLPFRVEINPHIMRLCGLTESECERIRQTLDVFYKLLPGLVANIAFLSAGALPGAENSPYPARTI